MLEHEINAIAETSSSWNVVSIDSGEIRCTITCCRRMATFQIRGAEVLRNDPESKYGDGNYWYPVDLETGEPCLEPVERPYPDHLDPVKIHERHLRSVRMKQNKAKRFDTIVKIIQYLEQTGVDLGPAKDEFLEAIDQ